VTLRFGRTAAARLRRHLDPEAAAAGGRIMDEIF
jgi:hypothetical protein